MPFKINALIDLKQYGVPQPFIDTIIEQAKLGDPDWFFDICSELDHIQPGQAFFLEEFHGLLLKADIKDLDIDTEGIYERELKAD